MFVYFRMASIYVEQDKFKSVDFPDKIFTTGLGPCIGIAFIDNSLKKAFLCHESSVEMDNKLPIYLRQIFEDCEKVNLNVWVTGGSLNRDDDDEYTEGNRMYVEELLNAEFAIDKVHYEWTPDNSYTNICVNWSSSGPSITHHRL